MLVKQKNLNHPPVITIFIGGIKHSQISGVYGIVLPHSIHLDLFKDPPTNTHTPCKSPKNSGFPVGQNYQTSPANS